MVGGAGLCCMCTFVHFCEVSVEAPPPRNHASSVRRGIVFVVPVLSLHERRRGDTKRLFRSRTLVYQHVPPREVLYLHVFR